MATNKLTELERAEARKKELGDFPTFEELNKSPTLCGVPVFQFLVWIICFMVGYFLVQPLFKGATLFFSGVWVVIFGIIYGILVLIAFKHPMWIQTYVFHFFAKFHPKLSAFGSCTKIMEKV